jgi:hypothetical protein
MRRRPGRLDSRDNHPRPCDEFRPEPEVRGLIERAGRSAAWAVDGQGESRSGLEGERPNWR